MEPTETRSQSRGNLCPCLAACLGFFTRVDRDEAPKAPHNELSQTLSEDEIERRHLSKALLPLVRRFYDGYIDPALHQPFYRLSSRV